VPIYDFNAIVSAVGGSLGLFLGFSCLGVTHEFLEKLEKKFILAKRKAYSLNS